MPDSNVGHHFGTGLKIEVGQYWTTGEAGCIALITGASLGHELSRMRWCGLLFSASGASSVSWTLDGHAFLNKSDHHNLISLVEMPGQKTPDQKMPFDPKKPVQTRDGRKARILATDLLGVHPIAVAIRESNYEIIEERYADGTTKRYPGDDDDLVNVPEMETKDESTGPRHWLTGEPIELASRWVDREGTVWELDLERDNISRSEWYWHGHRLGNRVVQSVWHRNGRHCSDGTHSRLDLMKCIAKDLYFA